MIEIFYAYLVITQIVLPTYLCYHFNICHKINYGGDVYNWNLYEYILYYFLNISTCGILSLLLFYTTLKTFNTARTLYYSRKFNIGDTKYFFYSNKVYCGKITEYKFSNLINSYVFDNDFIIRSYLISDTNIDADTETEFMRKIKVHEQLLIRSNKINSLLK